MLKPDFLQGIRIVLSILAILCAIPANSQMEDTGRMEISAQASVLPPGFSLAVEHSILEGYTLKSEVGFNFLLIQGSRFGNRDLTFQLLPLHSTSKRVLGYYLKFKDSYYGHREVSGFEVTTYLHEIYFIGGGVSLTRKKYLNDRWFIGNTLSLGVNIPVSTHAVYYPPGSNKSRSLYLEPALNWKVFIGFKY